MAVSTSADYENLLGVCLTFHLFHTLAFVAFMRQLVCLVFKYFTALFFTEAIPYAPSTRMWDQMILFSPILQSIRLNNLADSVQILTQSLTLLSIRYLCNVYERSSWWLKPSCRSTLISSWSSHDVKSPSKCISRYRSCSIEQHRSAGCEGWGGEEDSYTL